MTVGRQIFPTPSEIQRANADRMRRAMTVPERQLWKAIRSHVELRHTHFRRQVSLGRYIVDLCCHSAKLILEVDGNQHASTDAAYDSERTAFLQAQGFRVLRFSNRDVMHDMGGVLRRIEAAIKGKLAEVLPTPTPNPSPQGGGELIAGVG